MDLHGNISHIGRANWGKLDQLKQRQRAAQRGMNAFANVKKVRRHTGEDWKRYVAARREFFCASAKLENYIKDLHFQAAAYLCKNSDVILLPKVDSKSMLLTSAPWTHKFNSHMQTLAHFQFRQRLLAKCAVLGKTLVLCSEMYTSRTCGRCNRLHFSLRNQDMFVCPHCDFVANRDENAAFNIIRFVCAGSLSVVQVNGEQQQ